MNCWFCDNPLVPDNNYCENQPCRPYYVTYVFFESHTAKEKIKVLYRVQLKVTLWNARYQPREYIIDYNMPTEQMVIQERITPPFDPEDESVSISYTFKQVLTVPFSSPIITPQNYKTKLPLLLTFS